MSGLNAQDSDEGSSAEPHGSQPARLAGDSPSREPLPNDSLSSDGLPGDSPPSESIEQLFRQHNDALLRFLTARLHSSQEAKEVAQEAYVKMLGLRDTGAVSFLQAYLFKTAANLASNRIRDRAIRQRIDELVFFETPEERSPEYSRLADEQMALLRRAVDELPEPCRSAFILVQLRDLSINDAAKTLGQHPRTVRRLVERALEHCHKVVYESETGQGGTR